MPTKRTSRGIVVILLVVVAVGVSFLAYIRSADATNNAESERRSAGTDEVAPSDWFANARYHQVAVIGDSYTAGTEYGGQDDYFNWIDRLVFLLRQDGRLIQVAANASGGSGYINPGPNGVVFGQLVPRIVKPETELTVLFGSRNDIGKPGLSLAVSRVLADIKLRAPRSRIIVVSPPWVNDAVPAGLIDVRDALRTESELAGAQFVDTISEKWFFGADSKLISVDGIHPTNAGHVYMARKLLPLLESEVDALG